VRLVDRRPALPPVQASRAVLLHPRSMESLHHLGLLSNILPYVAASTASRLMDGAGTVIADIDYLQASRDTLFPCMFTVSQGILERILYDKLLQSGGFVEWDTELVGLQQDADGVEARFADGHRTRHDYVVGCDGAHSLVSRLIGNAWPGEQGCQSTMPFEVLMADVSLQSPVLPPRTLTTYLTPNIVAMFVPMPPPFPSGSGNGAAAAVSKKPSGKDPLPDPSALPPPPPQESSAAADPGEWRPYRINLHLLPPKTNLHATVSSFAAAAASFAGTAARTLSQRTATSMSSASAGGGSTGGGSGSLSGSTSSMGLASQPQPQQAMASFGIATSPSITITGAPAEPGSGGGSNGGGGGGGGGGGIGDYFSLQPAPLGPPPAYETPAAGVPSGHGTEAAMGVWSGPPALAEAVSRKLSMMASSSDSILATPTSGSVGSALNAPPSATFLGSGSPVAPAHTGSPTTTGAATPAGPAPPGTPASVASSGSAMMQVDPSAVAIATSPFVFAGFDTVRSPASAGSGSAGRPHVPEEEPWGLEFLATQDRLDHDLHAAGAADADRAHELEVREFLRHFADVAHLGQIKLLDVFWLARYKSRSHLVTRFRDRRVLVAGDAAHTHTSWGGLGMNAGLADAENLAWKLDLVLKNAAPLSLLDTYEEERRHVGKQMVQTAEMFAHIMSTRSYPLQVLRDMALAAATGTRYGHDSLTRALISVKYHYEGLSLTLGAPPSGHRLPPIQLHALPERIPCSVFDLLYRRPETVIFMYCGCAQSATDKEWMVLEDAAASVRSRYSEKAVSICWIAGDDQTAELASAITDGIVFLDIDGGFASLMSNKPGRLILRPDGFVGAVMNGHAHDDLLYLSRFLR